MDHRAAKVGSSEDRILEEITLAVCAVAAVSGGLGPAMVEEELAKIAIGRLTGCLYEQSDQVKLDALKQSSEIPRIEGEANAAEAAHDALLEEADQVEQGRGSRRKVEEEALAEVDVLRAEFADLPLMAKVAPRWRVTVVAMLATSAGLGALAHLSLERIENPAIQWIITAAAIAGALTAELVLGTLGAEAYDGLPQGRRRAILLVPAIVIVVLLVGTEAWAALVRNAGAAATNVRPTVGSGGKLTGSDSITPSILWTAPLSMLVTMAGSGIVALSRIRDSSSPVRERLEDAQARLRAARKALREDEERAERCREQARQQRASALALRGQMAATQIYSQHLVQTMQELTRRYEGYIESVRGQAIMAYRNAAEARERSADVSRRAAARRSATVFGRYTTPLVFAFAVVVGLAAVEATASAFAGVVAGAVVMLFASLARESE